MSDEPKLYTVVNPDTGLVAGTVWLPHAPRDAAFDAKVKAFADRLKPAPVSQTTPGLMTFTVLERKH